MYDVRTASTYFEIIFKTTSNNIPTIREIVQKSIFKKETERGT
jgi:hypothetical protein